MKQSTLQALGFTACLSFLVAQACITWQWNLMMDDITFMTSLTHFKSIGSGFLSEVQSYMVAGRFYPVKYLANLLKWNYLPLNPTIFHAFNYGLLLSALALGAWTLIRRQTDLEDKAAWFLFLVGAGYLQRPLLDVIALNSIAEGWVILFLAAGLLCFPDRRFLYRFFFLLSALSKEPAIVVFGAAAAANVVGGLLSKPRKSAYTQAAIDLLLFTALAIWINKVKSSGTYLGNYSLFNSGNVRSFVIGFIKCSIGITPMVTIIIFGHWRQKQRLSLSADDQAFSVLLLLFFLGYLTLAIPRGTAGYLLIPPSFALFLLISNITIKSAGEIFTPHQNALVSVLFIGCLGISMVRYLHYTRGINETSLAFDQLMMVNHPRLILLNGEEAVGQGQELASRRQAPVRVESVPGSGGIVAPIKGDVVILELSTYFSKIGDDVLRDIGTSIGGWKQIEDHGVYRIFLGGRDNNL